MTEFQMVDAGNAGANTEEHEDKRTLVERMFFDHNSTDGNLAPLPIVAVANNDDWRRYNDCIPLIRQFGANDPDYNGPLKNKDVLVFGGRRKGRAGTGVELMIAVEDVERFCSLAQEVAASVRGAVREEVRENEAAAA